MRFFLLPRIVGLTLLLNGVAALAESVIAEGVGQIREGNLPIAREEAIRNALGEATRRSSLNVRTASSAIGAQLAFDQTIVRSSASIYRHQVLSESHDDELYRVTISADLESASGKSTFTVCRDGHVKRLLIGGFPLLRPEQLQMDELQGYAHLTASEIARRFNPHPSIFVDYKGSLMVHFGVPERVIGDMPKDAQALPLIRAESEKHRAQYLLVGRFHSLALSQDKSHREIDVEALILDPLTGSCVARKRFSKIASGNVVLPHSIGFGSAAHYATDFGAAYRDVLSQVAAWAEATTSCLPLSARILKSEGQSVYFDAGAEQGISIGDTFSAFKTNTKLIVARGGEILGREKTMAGEVRVKSVYPRFSIGEFTPPPSHASSFELGLQLESGDELYSH